MVFTPKGGAENRMEVFEFSNGGGVSMCMYNTDEVSTLPPHCCVVRALLIDMLIIVFPLIMFVERVHRNCHCFMLTVHQGIWRELHAVCSKQGLATLPQYQKHYLEEI